MNSLATAERSPIEFRVGELGEMQALTLDLLSRMEGRLARVLRADDEPEGEDDRRTLAMSELEEEVAKRCIAAGEINVRLDSLIRRLTV